MYTLFLTPFVHKTDHGIGKFGFLKVCHTSRAKRFVIFSILLFLSTMAFSLNLYVNGNADPTFADGTAIHPFTTIQDAINYALNDSTTSSGGDPKVRIRVYDYEPGYAENIFLNFSDGHTPLYVQEITIESVSSDPDRCFIMTANENITVPILTCVGNGITNFSVMGIGFKQETVTNYLTSRGIYLDSAGTARFNKLFIHNCKFENIGQAVYMEASVDSLVVTHSEYITQGHSGASIFICSYQGGFCNDYAYIADNKFICYDIDAYPTTALELNTSFSRMEIIHNEFSCCDVLLNLNHSSDRVLFKENRLYGSHLGIGTSGEWDIVGNAFIGDGCLIYDLDNYAVALVGDGEVSPTKCNIDSNIFINTPVGVNVGLSFSYQHPTRRVALYMVKNSFINCPSIVHLQRNTSHTCTNTIELFRDNLYYADNIGGYNEPFTFYDEYDNIIELTGDALIPVSYSHFSNQLDLSQITSLDIDESSVTFGDPHINLNLNGEGTYTLIWDENVKSPLINTGCPEIDGVSQSDPDGTPPDIGARYYPHHHRKYFDRTDGSGIYWLSFPVLDDKSQTNGSYWNELGNMFNEYMYEPYQALNLIHWSYDGHEGDMSYDPGSFEWENTNHTAEQPKGYKVKFNPEMNYDPLLVNGFKADPVTTPVAWVEEYLHNGQMQDFLNSIGYFVPDTQDAGYALSRNLPGSSRFTYLDFVHTIKTRNWSTYRISEEMNSPWIIDPDTYTLSEGNMVELLLLPGAPEEMYWNTGLHVAPRERPRATAFSYEEKLDYTSLIIEFDPDDLPREVGVYIDGECKGASVVDSSVVDICVYPDEAKSGGEASIVFYYEGKGAKAAQGWKLYNPKSMVFEDGTLSLSGKDGYSYISFKHKAGDSPVPLVTALHQNYPNPFNPDTNISFILGSDMPVILDVFNIKGQKVKRLCDRELPRGQHSIQWNGRDADNRPVASGMYFYRLSSPEGVQTRKMMLMK